MKIKGEINHGIRGRILFSFISIHFYVGGWIILDEVDDNRFGEIGVLFKFPLKIKEY